MPRAANENDDCVSMPPMSKADCIILGHIIGAHGIKGDVIVKVYTEEPENIGHYGALTDPASARKFQLTVLRVTPKGVIARIKGVGDRNAAEALKGSALTIAREKLPEPEDDAWYFADLVGLIAEDPAGTRLGEVIAVHNFGAGDLLEIRLVGKPQTALVPFRAEFVPEVDIERRRVVIAPAPGLLD